MKFILTCIYALVGCLTSTFAQSENITAQAVPFKVKVGGAIEYLGEDKVYKVIAPEEAAPARGQTKKFSIFNSGFGLDAKRAKGDDPYYKAFRIISPGMKGTIREEDEKTSGLIGNGFVKKIWIQIPLSIEILDAGGQTERTLTVISESQEIFEYYHLNTMTAGILDERVPFPTAEQMNKQYQENKEAILVKLERDAIQRTVYAKAKAAIQAAYGANKYSLAYVYAYNPSKSATGTPADLVTQCTELKNALTGLNDKAKEAAALPKVESANTYFTAAINAGSIPSGYEQLYLGNAALTSLIIGRLADSENYFSKFYIQYTDNNKTKAIDYSTYYESLFEIYGYYHTIKQATEKSIVLPLTPKAFAEKANLLAEEARQKKLAEEAATKATMLPAFNGEPGFVLYLADGKKDEKGVKGKIYYDFNKATIESKGVTSSAPVKIITESGQSLELNALDVLYFIVGDQKYMRTMLKGANTLKVVAAVATGNLDLTEFWQVLQEDPDKAVYLQQVGRNEFAITQSAYVLAYRVDDILRKRKPARDFLDKCPQLEKAIDNKEIPNVKTRDDFKVFYQWIQNNCK